MMGGGPADEDARSAGSWRFRPPSAESVAAVIVTYHPDPGLAERVRPLIGQVGAIVVVDNGSSDLELTPVDALVREGVAETIRNGRNLGLAVALNQGLAWAKERGYAWALTLDQDTEPSSSVVPEAARVLAAYCHSRIAVIGAGYGDRALPGSSLIGREVVWVISSGGLLSLRAWQDLGGFRDDFFVDYVDIEFCLRARAGGYHVVQSPVRTVVHSIGRPTRRRLLFRWVSPTHHDRGRRYFITRNRIVVWRRYWRQERRWVASDFAGVVKDFVKIVFFESDRVGKIRAIARGVLDGMRADATGGGTWTR